jgi:PAS domain S-box-containing protein
MSVSRPPGSREARLQALARLNRLVSSSLDMDEVLRAIARSAAELMDVPAVTFWLVNERERRLELGGLSDPDLFVDFIRKSVSFEEGGAGWVATHRQPLNVGDITTDKRFFGMEWLRPRGLTSYFATPVLLGDTLLAVLAVLARGPVRFEPDDEELLEAFVGQAAVAINNARLFARSENARRLAQDLAELSRLLSQTLDIEQVAQAIANGIQQRLGVLASCVYHREPDTGDLIVMASSNPSGGFEWALVLPRGSGVAGLAAEEHAPVATPDALNDPRIRYSKEAPTYLERSEYRAMLAVPFLVKGRVIGALAVGDRTGRAFDAEAIELAQAYANQAAVALQNARLLDEAELRRQVAEEAQARYRSLYDGVPVGLYRSNPEGRIVDANPALALMLGYATTEEFIGSDPVGRYVDPADLKRWWALLEHEGLVRDYELQMRRLDGRVIWVRRSARVVRDAAGRVLHYECVQEDATEQKRAESAEREAAALRSVAQLANAAAHEINNPLLVITGRLELLARRFRDDDTLRAGLEQALASSRRITEIIAHMGRITRLELLESPGLSPILDLRRSGQQDKDQP